MCRLSKRYAFEALEYFCHDPLGKNVPTDQVLASVKKWLAAGVPSMFGFYGFPSFNFSNIPGGIPYPCPGEQAEWGHAIVQSDRGKTFELSQDDVISIRLDENPSTGYQWEVEAFDARIVELQNSDYTRTTGTGIGAGGIRTFTFQARSPGTVEIRLKLRRAWESEDAAIDRFQVTLRVQKK